MISVTESRIRIAIGVVMMAYATVTVGLFGIDSISPGTLAVLICAGLMLTRMGIKSQ